MKARYAAAAIAGVILVALVIFTPAAKAVGDLSGDAYDSLRLFTRVLALVETKYVEPVNVKDLVYGALNGMLTNLDPHSSFLTPKEFKELSEETSGKFGGLGIEITLMKDGYIGVISPIDDTPASRAGIQAGDVIVKIEGMVTKGMSVSDAVGKLRGQPGTKVSITIYREGLDKPFDVTIERAIIEVATVKSKVIEPGYGYVKLTQFSANANTELVKAIKALDASEKGLKGLVLDLRNNPGGLLDQAVEVSNEFLTSGLIVYTHGRTESQNMSFSASPGGVYTTGPLVMLVNGGSASASEILAGALQDQHRAVLVGTKTFGKGSVQTIMQLDDGAAIRLTTAKYFTPAGHDIQAKGITPDFVIPANQFAGMEPAQIKFMRERDLKGRLKNVEEEAPGAQPLPSENTPVPEEAQPQPAPDQEKVKPEDLKDPQLDQAMSILKNGPDLQKGTVNP